MLSRVGAHQSDIDSRLSNTDSFLTIAFFYFVNIQYPLTSVMIFSHFCAGGMLFLISQLIEPNESV